MGIAAIMTTWTNCCLSSYEQKFEFTGPVVSEMFKNVDMPDKTLGLIWIQIVVFQK